MNLKLWDIVALSLSTGFVTAFGTQLLDYVLSGRRAQVERQHALHVAASEQLVGPIGEVVRYLADVDPFDRVTGSPVVDVPTADEVLRRVATAHPTSAVRAKARALRGNLAAAAAKHDELVEERSPDPMQYRRMWADLTTPLARDAAALVEMLHNPPPRPRFWGRDPGN